VRASLRATQRSRIFAPQNENGLPEGKQLGCSAAWDGWEFPVASGNNKTIINSVV